MIVYIGLRISRIVSEYRESKKKQIEECYVKSWEEVLQDYEKNHDNSENIDEVNDYLFHTMFAERTETMDKLCLSFYELEVKIHKDNEAEIFRCLHEKIDPKITKVIHDAKFGSLQQRAIDYIQDCFGTKFITEIQNTENEAILQIFAMLRTILRLGSHYIDVFKDTFLTFTLLTIIGGPAAIINFPKNFTTVVVMGLVTSILLPLFMSSLHLAIYNPYLLFNLRLPKVYMRGLTVFCSFLVPIIIVNKYEHNREKIRKIAKYSYRSKIEKVIATNRVLNFHFVEFLRIELGNDVWNIINPSCKLIKL